MAVEITPEPSDEERKAILEALVEEDASERSGWGAAAPETWSDPHVVESGDPRQDKRHE
jgi:hypothetical protein